MINGSEVKPNQGKCAIVLASVKTYAQQPLSVVQTDRRAKAVYRAQLRDGLSEEAVFDPDIKLSPLCPKHP
jgi:hypothetical protein